MIVVTRQLRGAEKQVLCFSRAHGSFWRALDTERLLGMTSARRFPSRESAQLASGMMGGEVESIEAPEVPALLRRQAE